MTKPLRKIPLIVLPVLIVLAVLAGGCGRKAATTTAEPVIPVKTTAAAGGSVVETCEYAVTIEPVAQANVAAKIGGRVVAVPVMLGDYVRKGQTLVQLDQTDVLNGIRQAEAALEAARANYESVKSGSRPQQISTAQSQVAQAEVAFDIARKNYERMKGLYEQNLISRQQFEAAEIQLESARANLNAARQALSMAQEGATKEQLAIAEAGVHTAEVALQTAKSQLPNTVITAPVSGFVAMLNINPGEMVSPGVPVVGVADLSRVYAVANVGQSVIALLQKGIQTPVTFEINGVSLNLKGRVDQFAPASDPLTKTYKVKILLANPGLKLKAGMVGKASFTLRTSRPDSLVVPLDAVLSTDGREIVYVVNGRRAESRQVVTGITDGKNIEILSGLKAGELLIVSGQHRLKPSSKIEVK